MKCNCAPFTKVPIYVTTAQSLNIIKKLTISFSVLSDTTNALKFKQTENCYLNAKLSRDYCNLDVTYLVCEEKSY